MAKKLLLVRHCATSPEFYGKFIGASEVALGPDAPEQASRLAGVIAGEKPDLVFCSPLSRARKTLELMHQDRLTGKMMIEPDLREIDFGRWEGKSFEEITEVDSELVRRWSAWSPDFTFPEGEAVKDFLKRVHRVADRLASLEKNVVLVVAHGGVIRAMICHLLRMHPQNYLLFDVKPARLTVIDMFPEGGVLSGLNL
ncbi:MAG: histidine phosphatase family protein [Proteobacteria bacterium]|nr:histidine phosphatase family protein [Pseudomonadota bacterium]MBU1739532.1 histidine phosphatase family protein [Pseudomonadota bacterium]